MTANEIIRSIRQNQAGYDCPQWVREAALSFRPNKFDRPYDTTRAAFYTEVTIRVPAIKIARRSGQSYRTLQRRRLDVVAFVQPNYRAFEPLVIGVEIKASKSDLVSDQKFFAYLGFCHLFYFAAPPALSGEAHDKIRREVDTAGLLLATAGAATVSRAPGLRPVGDKNLKEIYAELLLKQFKSKAMSIERTKQ